MRLRRWSCDAAIVVAMLGFACTYRTESSPEQRTIAYVSPAKGTILVQRDYRYAAAEMLRADQLSPTEWVLRTDNNRATSFRVMEAGDTPAEDAGPSPGDVRVLRDSACSGAAHEAALSACEPDGHGGSRRVASVAYSTCAPSVGHRCVQTYAAVQQRVAFADGACQRESAREPVTFAWICTP